MKWDLLMIHLVLMGDLLMIDLPDWGDLTCRQRLLSHLKDLGHLMLIHLMGVLLMMIHLMGVHLGLLSHLSLRFHPGHLRDPFPYHLSHLRVGPVEF